MKNNANPNRRKRSQRPGRNSKEKSKGFYIDSLKDGFNMPAHEDHISVSRFISPSGTSDWSSRHLREGPMQDWPYQSNEGDDFLLGKIPDFFPDSYQEDE